jgi:hypothetical protein
MKVLKNISANTYFCFHSLSRSVFGVVAVLIVLLSSCKEKDPPTIIVVKNDETYSPDKVRPLLDEWQRKTFNYFYQGASPTGLALEGNDRGDVVTIGGGGFGVMALIVGVERGFITRAQGADQTRNIVRFLGKAERFKGVWSHWYNPDGTAHPFGNQVKTGDLIETSFMMAGLLAALEYYTQSTAVETEIRDSVLSFRNTIDWRFYTNSENVLNWLWYSQENRFALQIRGWNEGLISYILALGAPEPHNISPAVYTNGWLNNGGIVNPNRRFYDYKLPLGESYGGPLFFAHYSFLGLNPNLLEDNYVNYWQQNVAHTLINRHYCVYEAPATYKYSERDWGLTACYGAKPPAWNYSARSPLNDDGVIAPTASLGSYPYTPFYSTQMLFSLAANALTHGTYGFADAYCPSTSTSEKKHLAIDQGPIVIMIENYRSGLIWNLLMKNADVQRGLALAGMKDRPGFHEGFHKAIVNTRTKEYDMMRHPDRGSFELDYYVATAGNVNFKIANSAKTVVKDTTINALQGENLLKLKNTGTILNGKQYTITMKTPSNAEYSLIVRLR